MKSNQQRLTLAIGAVDSVNAYILPPLYQALRQSPTSISLRIGTHQSWELYNLVQQKELDVAFVLREMRIQNVLVEPFFTEQLVVLRLATPENCAVKIVSPEDISPDDELFVNWGPGYEVWHDRLWDPFCPNRLDVDTAALISALLTEPAQWSLVPLSVARQFMTSGTFVLQHLAQAQPTRTCYMISHRFKRAATVKGIEILSKIAQSVVIPLVRE